MLNDAITEAGEAMIGQGLSLSGGNNSVHLWNRYLSGKRLYIDRVVVASRTVVYGDLRYVRSPVGVLFPDHARNKLIDGPPPVAEIRLGGANQDYPYNRPLHEFWVGGTDNDRAYVIDPPIIVPQGRGIAAEWGGTCIASFQWREKADPLGPVADPNAPPPPPPGAPGLIPNNVGTPVGNLANPGNGFDLSETTYASVDSTSAILGKDWGLGNSKTISRLIIKSPSGRSFCGADPARQITWSLRGSDDAANWVPIASGVVTDSQHNAQGVIDQPIANVSTAYRAHQVILASGALSGWRVAELALYQL